MCKRSCKCLEFQAMPVLVTPLLSTFFAVVYFLFESVLHWFILGRLPLLCNASAAWRIFSEELHVWTQRARCLWISLSLRSRAWISGQVPRLSRQLYGWPFVPLMRYVAALTVLISVWKKDFRVAVSSSTETWTGRAGVGVGSVYRCVMRYCTINTHILATWVFRRGYQSELHWILHSFCFILKFDIRFLHVGCTWVVRGFFFLFSSF